MKIRTKAPNFALTKELNGNTNKSTKFWLKVWQDLALAREYDVDIEKYPINRNRQTSLVLLIPNCTRHRMIVLIPNCTRHRMIVLIPNCTRHRMITYTNPTLTTRLAIKLRRHQI